MSRLTERQSAGYDLVEMKGAWCDNYCAEQSKATCRDCAIWKAIQKLAHYEDLEEQLEKLYGGRLSLDNVVDNLNRIVQNGEEKLDFARILTNAEAEKWDKWKDLEEQNRLIELPCPLLSRIYKATKFDGVVESVLNYIDIPKLDKTVFLTKEEAEAKLEELNNE